MATDPRLSTGNERLRTPMTEFWLKFKRQPVAVAAGIFVIFLIVLAFIGPMISPYDPENSFDYDLVN